jgi:hypothetical protein
MPFGDDFDVYPMAMGANDPLVDWGSNLRPGDIQQYLHDPEGFKQRMIEAGQPPPDFHFTAGADGRPTPLPPGVPPPDIRETPQGLTLFDPAAQRAPLPRAIAGGPAQAGGALGYTGETSPLEEGPYAGQGGAGYKPREQPPAAAAPANNQTTPAGRVYAPAARPETGAEDLGGVPGVPTPVADPRKAIMQADQDRAKAQALTDFAKSLQGVKMPQVAPYSVGGAPNAPHPLAVSAPNLANILALAGQGGGVPSAAPQLARLLGRI